MLQWLMKNKDWLFSGAGVAFIGAVISIIAIIWRKHRTRLKADKSMAAAMTPGVLLAPPQQVQIPANQMLTPFSIRDTAQNTPLLLQPEIAKQFYGIKVKWDGALYGVSKVEEGVQLRIICEQSEETFTESVLVYFTVNPADYPGLGLLKSKDKVLVEGVISHTSDNNSVIGLTDAHIWW